MKKLALFGLVLIATMIVGGMTNPVYAQDDPEILLKIANNAQEQIRKTIPDDASDKIKTLFQEGSNQVDELKQAISNDDVESAKKHFLSAMRIFKEISQILTQTDAASRTEIATSAQPVNDPTSDLLKLYRYASSLKTIAEKHNVSIDFTKLNDLFIKAKEEISSKQYANAHETIQKISQIVHDIEKQLREQASQQESERAQKYAQKYLEQLDRLIESARNQGISDEVIKRLEDARTQLSSASNPEDIVKEVRKIISIKDQFELTKNDRLESRIMQVEKTLLRLSQMDGVEPQTIEDARDDLQKIKRLLSDGEFEKANEYLRNLADELKEITTSIS